MDGSVGDVYDNARAESQVGPYKVDLIWVEGPGATSSTSSWKP